MTAGSRGEPGKEPRRRTSKRNKGKRTKKKRSKEEEPNKKETTRQCQGKLILAGGKLKAGRSLEVVGDAEGGGEDTVV